MTPPRPSSPARRLTRDRAIKAIADAVEAERQATADRINAVAAARSYTPEPGEVEITWREIAEALGEPHVNHVIAHYRRLFDVQETRTVTVAEGAVELDRRPRRRAET